MKTFQTDLGTVQKVFCFVLEAAHKNKQISCTFTAGVYLCLEKQKQDATLSDWQIIIVSRDSNCRTHMFETGNKLLFSESKTKYFVIKIQLSSAHAVELIVFISKCW